MAHSYTAPCAVVSLFYTSFASGKFSFSRLLRAGLCFNVLPRWVVPFVRTRRAKQKSAKSRYGPAKVEKFYITTSFGFREINKCYIDNCATLLCPGV